MTLKVSDIGEKELVKYIIANSKKITPDDTAVTPFLDTTLLVLIKPTFLWCVTRMYTG